MLWKSLFREFSARIYGCTCIEQRSRNKREKTTAETRVRETTKEIRKKENNCEINVFGRKSETQKFNTFYRRWFLNILGLTLRTGIVSFGCNCRDTFV